MMQSMNSAVSGLNAQQTAMDVIGDDIANVSTYGYQSSSAVFEEALAQTDEGATAPSANMGGTNPVQVGLGVQVGAVEISQAQGSLTTTGNPSDLAIDGNGYFILGQGQQNFYTRDGSFQLDANSHLVSDNGLNVMGWMANATGVVNPNQPVTALQIPLGTTLTASATSAAVMQGNLASSTAPGGMVTSALNLYDSLGTPSTVTLTFTEVAPTQWTWAASGSTITAVGAGVNSGTLNFSPTGTLTASTGALQLDNTATGANTPQAVAVDFSGISQYSSPSTISPLSQNGYAAGDLTNYTVGTDGTITGTYTNGITQTIGQVALSSFTNPGGLTMTTDGNFIASANSGLPAVGTAETGGKGSIQAGTLEASNVNLADQFTNMITTERAYQADSKVITVADEMLQDLVNLQH